MQLVHDAVLLAREISTESKADGDKRLHAFIACYIGGAMFLGGIVQNQSELAAIGLMALAGGIIVLWPNKTKESIRLEKNTRLRRYHKLLAEVDISIGYDGQRIDYHNTGFTIDPFDQENYK